MKRAIPILLACGLAAGQELIPFVSPDFNPPAAAASCDTQQETVAPGALARNFLDGTDDFIASQVVPGSSYTVCRVDFSLQKVGSPTMNLSARIWSGTATAPTNLVASGSSIAASSLTTSYATNSFTISAALTSGVTYWFGLEGSALGDASNYVQLERTQVSPGYTKLSADGTTWTDGSTTRKIGFNVWR
jgi:hypothetical protein